MTRLRPFSAAMALLSVTSAAISACDPTESGPPEIPAPPRPENSSLGTRWIGIKTDPRASCADTLASRDEWRVRPLFLPVDGQGPLPDQLARYCLYEHTAMGAEESPRKELGPAGLPKYAPQASALGAVGGRESLEIALASSGPGAVSNLTEDSVVIAMQSPPNSPDPNLNEIRHHFRDRMHERTGGSPLNAPPETRAGRPRYAVAAILDSAPTALAKQAGADALAERDVSALLDGRVPDFGDTNDEHGPLMAFLANDRACPRSDVDGRGEACGVRTRTMLALPLRAPDVEDPEFGGHFGRRGDVAEALYQAVQSWRTRFLTTGDEVRLVIGLSLGWEPQPGLNQVCAWNPAPGAGGRAGVDAASLAVQDALSYAACHGVTVIAAAGNDAGGNPTPSGPMCPARFEEIALPEPKECEALASYQATGPDGVPVTVSFKQTYEATLDSAQDPRRPRVRLDRGKSTEEGAFERIVYSAGGVDFDDRALAPARPGSRPRLVLPSMGGAAAAGSLASRPELRASPRTGTSVAAANLVGITAALLARRPYLSPPEAIGMLYATGEPVDLAVEACSANAASGLCDVRRPLLCRALASDGVPCFIAPRHDVSPAVGALARGLALASPLVSTQVVPHLGTTASAAEPWAIEQPVKGGCPDCFWSQSDGFLYVVNPAWSTWTGVQSVTFSQVGAGGAGSSLSVGASGGKVALSGATQSVWMTVQYTTGPVESQQIVGVP